LTAALLLLAGATRKADAGWRWTPEIGRFVHVRRHIVATPEEMLARAQDFYRDGKYRQAISTYNEYFDLFPDSPVADQVQFAIAESYEARGRLVKAGEEYQKLIVNYGESPLYDRVVRKQYDIAAKFREQYVNRKGLGRLTSGRKLRHAIKIYEQVIENDPFGAGTAEAQYRLAECYFTADKLLEAKLEYEQVISRFPSSRWSTDARFYLALCEYRRMLPARYDQQNAQNALSGFTGFLTAAMSDHEQADEAQKYVGDVKERLAEHDYLVARFYRRRGRMRAALVCYQMLMRQYPNTSFAEKAQTDRNELLKEMTGAGMDVAPAQAAPEQ